jgi:hypothetical protein
MVVEVVTMGTNHMERSRGWGDPGLAWREKVGTIVAKMIERVLGRILHGRQEIVGDLTVLVMFLAMYIMPNIAMEQEKRRLTK